jgi:hypothetical protein
LVVTCVVALSTALFSVSSFAQEAAPERAEQPTAESDADREDLGRAGWDDGFFWESANGKFRYQLSLGISARYEYYDAETDTGDRDYTSRFLIRRLRSIHKGHVYTPRLTYRVDLGFDRSQAELTRAYLNYEILDDALHVRIGQGRPPQNREEMTSYSRLALVERSLSTDEMFGDDFDIGLLFHNGYPDKGFEWHVGFYNGNSNELGYFAEDSQYTPSVFIGAAIVRVAYQFQEMKPYRQIDLEGGPLRVSVGATGTFYPGFDRPEESAAKAGADTTIKVHGFSANGSFYVSSVQSTEPDSSTFDQEAYATGGHGQLTYLIADRVAPSVRYSNITSQLDDSQVQEFTGGFSVLPTGEHFFKISVDGGYVARSIADEDASDYFGRAQLNVRF